MNRVVANPYDAAAALYPPPLLHLLSHISLLTSDISYLISHAPISHISTLRPVFDQGTYAPQQVATGYYSLPADGSPTNRLDQQPCPVGYYCVNGGAVPCPAGVYGNVTGLSTSQCSGPCAPGYRCPANSSSATQLRCADGVTVPCNTSSTGLCDVPPESVYCPGHSGNVSVAKRGERTVGVNDSVEYVPRRLCERRRLWESVCVEGVWVCAVWPFLGVVLCGLFRGDARACRLNIFSSV